MTHLTFIRYFVPDSNEFAPGWYQTRNEGRTRIGDVPLSLSDALYDGPNRVIIDDNTPETNSLPVSGGKGVDEFLITRTANSVVIDDDSEANVIVFERDVVITSIERLAGSEGASVAQYVITLSSGKTITLRNPVSFTFQHLGDVTRTDPISAEDFFTAYEDGFAASDASHPDIIGDASDFTGAVDVDLDLTITFLVYYLTAFTSSMRPLRYLTYKVYDSSDPSQPIAVINLDDAFTDADENDTLTLTLTVTLNGNAVILTANGPTITLGDTGLTYNTETNSFSGTPSAIGTYKIKIVAADSTGEFSAETEFDIVIAPQTISGDDTGSVTEGGAPGDDNTGELMAPGSTITLTPKETTDSPGTSTGTYGVMRFNVSSGEWVYTLDDRAEVLAEGQTATELFTFSAGGGIFVVTITITGSNDAPVVATAIEPQSGVEGQEKVIDLSTLFTDVDEGDELTFEVTLDDGTALSTIGLTYDSDEDEITGTLSQIGEHIIKIVATDKSGATVETTFDLNILPAILMIQLSSLTYNPDETSITIDETILKITSENQSDPALLVYTITTLPDAGRLLKSGTQLNNGDTFTQADINNGLITYEPSVSDSSTSQSNPLSFTFSDGVADLEEQTLQITSREVFEDADADADEDNLIDLSVDLDLTITFLVYYLTAFTSSIDLRYLTYKVYDSTDPSQPIAVINLGDAFTDADENDTLTLTLTVILDGNAVILTANGPTITFGDTGLTYNTETNILSGNPSATGTYKIKIVAADSTGEFSAETEFDIVIAPQTISGDDTGSVTEGGAPGDDNTGTLTAPSSTITLTPKETTDSPGTSTGTYGVMTFNVSSGEWVYTLDGRAEALGDQQTATETFTFSAGGATFDVTITITGSNDAPVVATAIEPQSGVEGQEKVIDLSTLFTDVDEGDELTFEVTLDDGTALSTIGLTYDSDEDEITGTLSQIGEHIIKIVATDKSGATVETTFDLNILPAILMIQLSSLTYNPDETSITIDETILEVTSNSQFDPTLLVYTITTLPDAGRLLKSGTQLNNGDTFTQADINNGLITYEPDVSDSSTSQSETLSFTLSDGVADLEEQTLQITSRKVVGNTASAQDNTADFSDVDVPQKIEAGDGSDIITGGQKDDQIDGGAGDDEIILTRTINNVEEDAGADEVLYEFGYDGVGIDGGDEIVGFKRGQDKLTFVVERSFNSLTAFLQSLNGADGEDLTADDAFVVTMQWGINSDGDFYFDGVLLHFKDVSAFGGGRVSSPLVTVTFDQQLNLNDLTEILGEVEKVAENFDFTHAAFKNLDEVLPRLFGESSIDFVVIPFSNSISVIDGPVTGAEVFFDLNGDGEVTDAEKDAQRDESDRSRYITGDDGTVDIPEQYVGRAFVADVGSAYDTATGERLEGSFRSLDEGRGGIATPITDLIVTYLEEVEGQTGTPTTEQEVLDEIFGDDEVTLADVLDAGNYEIPADTNTPENNKKDLISRAAIALTEIKENDDLTDGDGDGSTTKVEIVSALKTLVDLPDDSSVVDLKATVDARVAEVNAVKGGKPIATPTSVDGVEDTDYAFPDTPEALTGLFGFRDPEGNDPAADTSSFRGVYIRIDIENASLRLDDNTQVVADTDLSGSDTADAIAGYVYVTFDNLDSLKITPAPNFNGDLALVYRVWDGEEVSSDAELIINIAGVNDAPVVDTAIGPQRGTVDLPITAIILENFFSDVDDDELTLTVTGLPSGLSYARDTGITGTPDTAGTFMVTVVANDGNGGTVETTFDIVVSAQAVSPFSPGDGLLARSGRVKEDENGEDEEEEVRGTLGNAERTLENGMGDFGEIEVVEGDEGESDEWVYTLDERAQVLSEGEEVTEKFTFIGGDGVDNVVITITVEGTNDDPEIDTPLGIQRGTVDQDININVNNLFTDIDRLDALTLTFTVMLTDDTEAELDTIGLEYDSANKMITGDPSAGTHRIKAVADDGEGGTVETTFTIQVSSFSVASLDRELGRGVDGAVVNGVSTRAEEFLIGGDNDQTLNTGRDGDYVFGGRDDDTINLGDGEDVVYYRYGGDDDGLEGIDGHDVIENFDLDEDFLVLARVGNGIHGEDAAFYDKIRFSTTPNSEGEITGFVITFAGGGSLTVNFDSDDFISGDDQSPSAVLGNRLQLIHFDNIGFKLNSAETNIIASPDITRLINQSGNGVGDAEFGADDASESQFLIGGDNKQTLNASSRGDVLFGGKGDDTINLGSGDDVVYYRYDGEGTGDLESIDGNDTIEDFDRGDDVLVLAYVGDDGDEIIDTTDFYATLKSIKLLVEEDDGDDLTGIVFTFTDRSDGAGVNDEVVLTVNFNSVFSASRSQISTIDNAFEDAASGSEERLVKSGGEDDAVAVIENIVLGEDLQLINFADVGFKLNSIETNAVVLPNVFTFAKELGNGVDAAEVGADDASESQFLIGGDNDQTLNAGTEGDVIFGGKGDDIINLGDGKDFVFYRYDGDDTDDSEASDGADVINDFDLDEDVLVLVHESNEVHENANAFYEAIKGISLLVDGDGNVTGIVFTFTDRSNTTQEVDLTVNFEDDLTPPAGLEAAFENASSGEREITSGQETAAYGVINEIFGGNLVLIDFADIGFELNTAETDIV